MRASVGKDSIEKDNLEFIPVNVPVKLTDREKQIIDLMRGNSITSLKEKNILVRIGADKNGEWKVLNDELNNGI